jgi:hypothetical protein
MLLRKYWHQEEDLKQKGPCILTFTRTECEENDVQLPCGEILFTDRQCMQEETSAVKLKEETVN